MQSNLVSFNGRYKTRMFLQINYTDQLYHKYFIPLLLKSKSATIIGNGFSCFSVFRLGRITLSPYGVIINLYISFFSLLLLKEVLNFCLCSFVRKEKGGKFPQRVRNKELLSKVDTFVS